MVAATVALPAALGIRPAVHAGAQPGSDRSQFVGTYRLLTIEVKDARGSWAATPGFASIGYITYAETGHMGVHIMPRQRARFADTVPTADEAEAALRGYTAYFGTFTVNGGEKFVIHRRAGQINPGGDPEVKRFFDFDGDRLILTPPPADGGGKDKAARRLVWERLPNPPLSAEAKKFVGFYKLLYTDSYRERDGKEIFHGDRNETRAGSYIIYTPTGHMMVHLMDKDGRSRPAGAQMTAEEALKAYRSYGGYFGRFTTYENHTPRFVMHNQQGTLNPGRDVDATKRFYVFTGNVLRLGAPPTLNAAGETAGGHLYWERLSSVK
jgi:hypothetical protein